MKLNIKRFAIEGSNYTTLVSTAGNKARLEIYFIENSTDTVNNTSNITVTGQIKMTSGSYSQDAVPYLKIYWHNNETNQDVLLKSAQVNALSSSFYTLTESTDQPHAADGSGSGYAWAEWTGSNFRFTPQAGAVGTLNTALTTIPRASTISATDANIGSASTITISRASNSFTHTVTYSFTGVDSSNQTITRTGTIATKTSNVQLSFTLPGIGDDNNLYPLTPNSKELYGTLTCETFSGNTSIGTSTCQIKAMVSDNDKPTVAVLSQTGANAKIVDTDNISKNTIQCFVQGKSILSFDMSSAFSTTYSSPVNSYVLKINGEQVHNDTANTYVMTSPLPNTTNKYELIIYDKRGNFGTTGEQIITAYEYSVPACSIRAERDGQDAEQVNITYSVNIKNIGPNGGNGNNAHSITIDYRQTGTTGDWTTVSGFPINNAYTKTNVTTTATQIDDDHSYDFRITVSDSYNTISETVQVSTSATLLNFNANGATMAFGKASESATEMEIAIPTDFQKIARFKEGIQGKELYASGTGYLNCFTLSTTGTNITQAIMFDVLQIGRSAKARIVLGNSGTAGNMTLTSFYKEGNSNLYYLVDNNTVTIYVQKNGTSDKINIVNLEIPNGSEVKITWNGTRVSSLPTGYGTATVRASNFGYGITTSATNNSDSNLMTSSGVKKAIVNYVYPVGSFYSATSSTNPSSTLGGTWVEVPCRYVIASGSIASTDLSVVGLSFGTYIIYGNGDMEIYGYSSPFNLNSSTSCLPVLTLPYTTQWGVVNVNMTAGGDNWASVGIFGHTYNNKINFSAWNNSPNTALSVQFAFRCVCNISLETAGLTRIHTFKRTA